MRGCYTLFKKEVIRFWKVAFQTIAAPVLTALMYQLVFAHVLSKRVDIFPGVEYLAFLIPGLAMMSMAQNAFANSSSSLVQSKITGNLVFILLPPLSSLDFFLAYLCAAIVRALCVGLGVILVTMGFGLPFPEHIGWALLFALMGSATLGSLGIIAGIWAEKFDQMASFQNFIIMPLTFLSGVFYSIKSLPEVWQWVTHLNPIFYMIDGFRYGFFGKADVSPYLALFVVSLSFVILSAIALRLLQTGYKLRH